MHRPGPVPDRHPPGDDARPRPAAAPAPAPAATPCLELQHLSKRYGDTVAVDDVTLSIARGEFVCVLGPSGCGKTTLLRAICGLDPQSFGRIAQDGRDVSALPPAARDFGIVFQSYALFPNLTVARNVAYGLENRRLPRARIAARTAELLALVGLTELAGRYPAELSGGQQQRVALARALAPSPGLLLLDEPLSALDARVRAHLRREIRALQRRLGVTTIMITHDQEEAIAMADRIVVMNRGRIEQTGTPADLYARPATPFVAGFVGEMNFLPATIAAHGRVRLGSLVLDCAIEGFPGGELRLAIRPEEVELGVADGHDDDDDVDDCATNGFHATIAAAEFLGPLSRVQLAIPGLDGLTLGADVPAACAAGYRVGARVRVQLPAARLRCYPRADA